jgi:uncharacterized protein (TIGR00730 family)
MADRAEAFVILPGGLGTLDEGMEILAWRQLRFHDRPVVIVNVDGYWDPLLAMLERAAAEGFIYARGKTLFRVVTQVEHVLPAIAAQLAE